jgi:hypothetical protein
MRIVILGWGSLIWESSKLPLGTDWIQAGPVLPLEFSRISESRRGALTLVIDPENGTRVQTRHAVSQRVNLEETINDLTIREKTSSKSIGYINLSNGSKQCNFYPEAYNIISRWAAENNFDAVVWTDLLSNFLQKTGSKFGILRARDYLKSLPQHAARKAREYINNAPSEVDTTLRIMLRGDPWLNA